MRGTYKKALAIIMIIFLFSTPLSLFDNGVMDAVEVSSIAGTTNYDLFGSSISDAGDVNGDGINDIIVGAPDYGSDIGRAYIFYGGNWLNGSLSADTANVTITGMAAGDNFGWDVTGAGDVNKDGYDDIVIGALDSSGVFENGNSLYRKKLVFNNSGQAEAIKNFPVLIKLDPANFDYSHAKVDGTDLRFYQRDNIAELKYHIETWTPGGESHIWVNVTEIKGSSSTDHIWMYYGNPYADDVQDNHGTYDGNFMGVWHLNETGTASSGEFKDSTSNSINGTGGGGVGSKTPVRVYGMSGYGQDFDGKGDHIDFGIGPIPDMTYHTITTWVNLTMDGDPDYDVIGYENPNNPFKGIAIYIRSSDGAVGKWWGASITYSSSVSVNGGEWAYVSIRGYKHSSSGYVEVSVNGGAWDRIISGDTQNLAISSSNQLSIGGWISGGPSYDAKGVLDEVQISNINRSDDWIKAQYLSISDKFITFGFEEVYNDECGAAYVYYGNSTLPSNTDAWNADETIYGAESGAELGYSVSNAGDLNNDGYDDIIIGFPSYDTGGMYVLYGSGSGIDGSKITELSAGTSGDKYGFDVNGGFNINGDNYDDVIVGAPFSQNGSAYVYLGGKNGVGNHDLFNDDFETDKTNWDDNGATLWALSSDQKYGGTSSIRAVDTTDGYLTSDNIDLSSSSEAVLDFRFRKSATEANDINLQFYDGTKYNEVLQLDGEGSDDTWLRYYAGIDLTLYGINNFRIRFNATLGVSEYAWIDNLSVKSWHYPELFSFADGFELDKTKWDDNGPSLWDIASDQVYAGGSSIRANDLNDGLLISDNVDLSKAKMAVLDFQLRKSATEANDIDLLYFDGAFFNTIDQLDAVGPDDTWLRYNQAIDLETYGSSDFKIRFDATLGVGEFVWVDNLTLKLYYDHDLALYGHEAGDEFGYCVAGAGNVDGQLYDDIIISSPASTSGKGYAYLYMGDEQVGPLEDVNLMGEGNGDRFGTSITTGNFNGDGYDDYAIGTSEKERVYVFYGNTTLVPFGDISDDSDHLETRREANEKFGWDLATIPSFNNSGIDYLMIGAPESGGTDDYGRVYIIRTAEGPVIPGNLESIISWIKIYNETGIEDRTFTVGKTISFQTNISYLNLTLDITNAYITITAPDESVLLFKVPMGIMESGINGTTVWKHYELNFGNPAIPGTYEVNISSLWDGIELGYMNATYELEAGEPYELIVSAVPSSILADGVNTSEVSISVYDAFGNPRPGLSSEFILSMDQGAGSFSPVSGIGDGTYNFTYTSPTVPEPDAVINITIRSAFNKTTISLLPMPLYRLEITPSDISMVVNGTQIFQLKGYDLFDNPVELIGTIWTSDVGGFESMSDTAVSLRAITTVGTGHVNASIGPVSCSASVKLVPGPAVRIEVGPDPIDVVVSSLQQFSANCYDKFDNSVTLTTTEWSTDMGTLIATNNTHAVLRASTTPGQGYIQAKVGALIGSAVVNIIPDILDRISVIPAAVNVSAGGSFNFSAVGYDMYDNVITINPAWTTTVGDMTGSMLNAGQKVWSGYVNASIGSIVGTAVVNIVPDKLASIIVIPGNVELEAGSKQQFLALGYDRFFNDVEIEPIWRSDAGTILDGELTASTKICSGYVKAQVGPITGSANVTVSSGPLDRIVVVPSDVELVAGTDLDFNAVGYDRYNNSVSIDPMWFSENSIGTMTKNTLNTGIIVDKGTVTAVYQGKTGIANVTIIPDELDQILVFPSKVKIVIGNTQDFSAVGYDRYDNIVDIDPEWSTDVGTMEGSLLTAQLEAGTGYVIATESIDNKNKMITGLASVEVEYDLGPNTGRPRIIGIVPDQVKPEDSPPWELVLSEFESDNVDTGDKLKWYASGVNTSLFSVSGELSTDDKLTFTPVRNAFGSCLITLWLTDSENFKDTQPIWVNLTPVNDRPSIYGVPDLFVHYDHPYTFSVEPYISDVETPVSDLKISTLETSGYGYTSVDDMNITFTYPETMLNFEVFVTIEVSDGEDSAKDVISVIITDNWVPEVNKPLPDLFLFEGTYLNNAFDLDDYFLDPDKDSLFYSYGETYVNITINTDHVVDVSSLSEWSGTDKITFRAIDTAGALAEDTILVTVMPVNDPPTISDVPDLVVHYDLDYTFDLAPYINDNDNETEELRIYTSELNYIRFDELENAKMIVNYPESMNGLTVPVTISVSDGIEVARKTIDIRITDDFPPELRMRLPDIELYEDELLESYIDLDHYFFDADGDSLFYTYGNSRITIQINGDNTVDIGAAPNWYGEELVTFRAKDPQGALTEDTILITVIPVNDAPEISILPDQKGKAGHMWVLDLDNYISDIDNSLGDIRISVESDLVVVSGYKLVFFSDKPTRKTITVNVTDGEAYSTRSFIVTFEPGEDVLPVSSVLYYLMVLIIILATLGLIFIFKKYNGNYVVEEVYLIYENGSLLRHLSNKKIPEDERDDEIISGMFTAMQDFITDSFADEHAPSCIDAVGSDQKKPREWQVQQLEMEGHKISIRHGQKMFIAVIYTGTPGWKMNQLLTMTMNEINEKYSDKLMHWKGNMKDFDGIDTLIDPLIDL